MFTIDELAEIAETDPLAYRLAMTSARRADARCSKHDLGEICGWARRGKPGTGQGLGLAYDRHRDRGAFVAVAAELSADEEVWLMRMWCVADCGLVINPDGAKNWIEARVSSWRQAGR